MSELKFKLW